jgi:hypothetical protein
LDVNIETSILLYSIDDEMAFVETFISRCSALIIAQHDTNLKVTVVHQRDDILITVGTFDDVKSTMDKFVKIF